MQGKDIDDIRMISCDNADTPTSVGRSSDGAGGRRLLSSAWIVWPGARGQGCKALVRCHVACISLGRDAEREEGSLQK
jgi:hypothetical protein